MVHNICIVLVTRKLYTVNIGLYTWHNFVQSDWVNITLYIQYLIQSVIRIGMYSQYQIHKNG